MPDNPARALAEKGIRSTGKTVRVFFAIWPDNAAQEQMAGLATRLRLDPLCGGRKTKGDNIHLTLVFVGEVDAVGLQTLLEAGNKIGNAGTGGFDFVIDAIRYWKHNQIVYATTDKAPQRLTDLVSALQGALSAAGFFLEQRPYIPHITLMKRASCRIVPKLPEPVVWRVREWMLVKSEQTSDGSVYTPIHRWSLGGVI
ncbi:RNA 2',3'-cyclic phosphodiesterase [Nitrosovibrio tenuis]|uniref:RNA 2',3'-cyclic phosphodiesterase n=1 Tax=Nitrosovibrio tenuis TaxID=1233 RepID=A0A1H7QBB7_9PROT|nr:RNA 2',3'-cyclic phosphodiesterase [Nitrosovibrio tenuis]SEL45451.1 2'-5' RNA ligase [Nitrosovibrio tenuis]